MEFELKHILLEGCRPVLDAMFTQEETLESIVPDACPDIARIVSASGGAFLKDKELGEGTLRLTGTAKVTVLYIPEGEALPKPLEVAMPFQCVKDDPRFRAGAPVHAAVQLVSADARTLNPRKVLVRASLSVWAAAYEPEQRELCCDAEGQGGLEKRFAPCKCRVVSEVKEKVFAFSDVLRPPASRPEMEELLLCRPELGAVDAKFIGKKLVLKGDVQLAALYLGEGKLSNARFELPYSQVIDLGDAPEEAEPEVVVALQTVDCHLQDGELEVALEALVQAALWVDRPVTLLADAYCTGQSVEVDRAPAQLCTMAERTARREMARKLCESGIPARQVLDCAVSVSALSRAPAEGGAEFEAQVNASVLYLSEDDALCGVEAVIPVSTRVELPEGCACSCRCRTVGEPAAVPVTGGLEVRFEAEFALTTLREEQVSCVTALRPGPEREAVDRPSVVIRRVGQGEVLWDVAKACGSTVADICGANGLPSGEAAAGTLLLIPARRG